MKIIARIEPQPPNCIKYMLGGETWKPEAEQEMIDAWNATERALEALLPLARMWERHAREYLREQGSEC